MSEESGDPLAGLPEPTQGQRPSPLQKTESDSNESERWWLRDSLQPEGQPSEPVVETSTEEDSAPEDVVDDGAVEDPSHVLESPSRLADDSDESDEELAFERQASLGPKIAIGVALVGLIAFLIGW